MKYQTTKPGEFSNTHRVYHCVPGM